MQTHGAAFLLPSWHIPSFQRGRGCTGFHQRLKKHTASWCILRYLKRKTHPWGIFFWHAIFARMRLLLHRKPERVGKEKKKKKPLYRPCIHEGMSCALNVLQWVHQSPLVLHLWPSPRWLFHIALGQPTGAPFWSQNREGSRPASVWLAKSISMGLGLATITWSCYTLGPLQVTGDGVRCNVCHVADSGTDCS